MRIAADELLNGRCDKCFRLTGSLADIVSSLEPASDRTALSSSVVIDCNGQHRRAGSIGMGCKRASGSVISSVNPCGETDMNAPLNVMFV